MAAAISSQRRPLHPKFQYAPLQGRQFEHEYFQSIGGCQRFERRGTVGDVDGGVIQRSVTAHGPFQGAVMRNLPPEFIERDGDEQLPEFAACAAG